MNAKHTIKMDKFNKSSHYSLAMEYPGEGKGNLLQDSCLENPKDSLYSQKESDMTGSNLAYTQHTVITILHINCSKYKIHPLSHYICIASRVTFKNVDV